MELAEPNQAPKTAAHPQRSSGAGRRTAQAPTAPDHDEHGDVGYQPGPHLTVEEASEMAANTKRAALAMFPDKEFAYDILYKRKTATADGRTLSGCNRRAAASFTSTCRSYNIAHGFSTSTASEFPSFRDNDGVPRGCPVLFILLFSEVREGITDLSVHPVAWSEPTILECCFSSWK